MKRSAIIVVSAVVALGVIAYAASKQSGGLSSDHKVPGVTTESSKSRVTD
jgi:hypothetical protein